MASSATTQSRYVLLSGGAGYVGSHTLVELLESTSDYIPIVVDNLYNASSEAIKRIEEITGKKVAFYPINLTENPATSGLEEIFKKYSFHSVINFAGLKAVGESMKIPLDYYQVNLTITFNLLNVMKKYNVKNFVFSSSACVYGVPQYLPLDENHPVGNCSNPYGKTKYFIEVVLQDLYKSEKDWNIVILRFFNPVGAHPSGLIGEDPKGIPNNLMPYVTQVAVGKLPQLSIYGNDYNTHDGTGVRDYIHIVDLAKGHVCSLQQLNNNCGLQVYNLGCGHGYSVLDIVNGMKRASGRDIPYKVVDRRDGDVELCYADVSKAEREMNWKAVKSINEMCVDAWRWQMNNPNGYTYTNGY